MADANLLRAAPVSAVVPTRHRTAAIARMLESLLAQDVVPVELIVIDASNDDATKDLLAQRAVELGARGCTVTWQRAARTGAAPQRNQGVALARQPIVAFFDDDIRFEAGCIGRLVQAFDSDPRLGGVNAMIVNQRYQPPGAVSRAMFRIMAGAPHDSYAGRLLGPAINLLPEDRPDLPEVVPVEWLNTTCTLYRRAALPDPPFADFFTGYSMMEDVALSAGVGRTWKLANARTACTVHDSQAGDHKSDRVASARMELVNRYYVMTQVLGRRRLRDYAKLALWESFQLAVAAVQQRLGGDFWRMLKGKCLGAAAIVAGSPARPAS